MPRKSKIVNGALGLRNEQSCLGDPDLTRVVSFDSETHWPFLRKNSWYPKLQHSLLSRSIFTVEVVIR